MLVQPVLLLIIALKFFYTTLVISRFSLLYNTLKTDVVAERIFGGDSSAGDNANYQWICESGTVGIESAMNQK